MNWQDGLCVVEGGETGTCQDESAAGRDSGQVGAGAWWGGYSEETDSAWKSSVRTDVSSQRLLLLLLLLLFCCFFFWYYVVEVVGLLTRISPPQQGSTIAKVGKLTRVNICHLHKAVNWLKFLQRFVLFCYKIRPRIPLYISIKSRIFSQPPSSLLAMAALWCGQPLLWQTTICLLSYFDDFYIRAGGANCVFGVVCPSVHTCASSHRGIPCHWSLAAFVTWG